MSLSPSRVLMMKLSLSSLLVVGVLVAGSSASAQSASLRNLPELPAASPAAETYNRAGLTDFRVVYSSPAARDRDIWGALVPYGEVWRAGANAPTKLSVSTEFTFGDTLVPAGEYTLLALPEDGAITWMLNTDSSGRGAYAYNEDENVATYRATTAEGPARERLVYLFTDASDAGAQLTLEWAGLTSSVPLGVDTAGIANAAISATLADAWRPSYNAARYYLDSGQDLAQAEAWMAESIAANSNWWNNWFMALIMAGQEKYADARAHATTAMELAEGDSTWATFFQANAESLLAEWPE